LLPTRGGESHTHFILAKQVFQGEAISIAFRQISLRLCRINQNILLCKEALQ
jgi:hypothetical protein